MFAIAPLASLEERKLFNAQNHHSYKRTTVKTESFHLIIRVKPDTSEEHRAKIKIGVNKFLSKREGKPEQEEDIFTFQEAVSNWNLFWSELKTILDGHGFAILIRDSNFGRAFLPESLGLSAGDRSTNLHDAVQHSRKTIASFL
jgi:hypothetical protein